jgi:intein/homing endonuclease
LIELWKFINNIKLYLIYSTCRILFFSAGFPFLEKIEYLCDFNRNKTNKMIKKSLEQERIFEEIKNGTGNILINAKAGTGKTTTIVKSLDLIEEDKSIMMLAFNKHIASELKERVPNRENLRVSTTHALGWGAIRRKYKDAVIDDDKAFKIIRRKVARWNLNDVDNIDQYILRIKKMVDLCRVTLTTRREFVGLLGQRHGIELTDEDTRRILSVMEDMYNDTKTFDFIDMVYIPAINNKIWLFPSDYVFVDECISGRNCILIKGNNSIKMIDLYKSHVNDYGELIWKNKLPEVLSYNVETGKKEYKKIKNIQYKGEKSLTLINLGGVYVLATPSHLFYTSEGWRETKDLKPGDLVISNKYERELNAYSPDEEQLDFLFTYRLCYGMTEFGKNKCKFRIYLKNKEKLKTKFISSITPLHVKSNKDEIKTTEYSTLKFYFNHEHVSQEYVMKNITDKQLGILYFLSSKYFDDIKKYGFYLSLKNFDEMVYAKELFERKFNTKFDIKYYIKGSYLVPRDQDWFFNIISPYVPTIFKDIIPEQYHEKLGQYKYNTVRTHVPMATVSHIKPDYSHEDVFDIEVEDNHNYFITSLDSKYFRKTIEPLHIGYLVHNCQDYNRAQQFMLNKIIKKDTGRLIAVGDEHQCQPTGTKVLMSDGNYKNIEDIVVGDTVVSYDRKQCWCFRGLNKRNTNYGYKILETAKRYINDELIVVESDNKITKYTYNHKCFAKFKNDDVNNKYVLYLMELNGYFRIGITPLWSKNKLGSLTHRAKAEKAEKYWMLNIYDNRDECYFDEQYYSVTYGIPQMIFTYRNNGNQNQENIDKFYSRFDKSKLLNSAIELLTVFKRKYEYPLWSKDKFNYFSKLHIFQIQACNLIPKYMEMVHYSTDNIGERTHGKNGRRDYTYRPLYKEINNIIYENYSGYVYSLKVETFETYVADGILTHNSIYGFNGSDTESFNWFRSKENTTELPLTTSYRSAKRIIELAQTIVPNIRYKEDAEDGEVTNGSVLELAKPGDFVLARKNKPLVVLLFDLLRLNKSATIRGNDIGIRIAETVKQYKTIPELNEGLNHRLTELRDNLVNNFGVIDFRNDPRYVALEDNVEIIRFLMNNTKTINRIIEKLSLIFTDKPEGIILSTVHKSKGLEADTVFIIRPDEIRLRTPIPEAVIQERNLEYIAYTRAKNRLIIDRDWTDERQ